jgi:hypothetical protein
MHFPLQHGQIMALARGSVVSAVFFGLYLLLLLTGRFFLGKLQVIVSEHTQQGSVASAAVFKHSYAFALKSSLDGIAAPKMTKPPRLALDT